MRELGYDECLEILSHHRFGRVAMRDADGVYIVPISYALEGDALYAHAAPGHKVQLMRRWPHVAIEVDEVQDAAHWRSVLVRGRFEELFDEEEKTAARMRLLKAFGGDISAVTAGHGHRVSLAEAVLFRVLVSEITGRAENC